jgi:hypothetical protein
MICHSAILLTPKPKQQGQTTIKATSKPSLALIVLVPPVVSIPKLTLLITAIPIPIIFGQSTAETGGILAAPSLVWSRAFSYGSQQGVKLMFVVGEQGTGANGIGYSQT